MSTIKVNNVIPPNAGEGVTIDGLQMPTAGPLSNRNLIINGAMQVAQRHTSKTNVSANDYPVDRFRHTPNGDTRWTLSQANDGPDGFSKSLKLVCTTADTSYDASHHTIIQYLIEAQDLQHLDFGSSSAKKITISFWVKSSKTGNASFGILQPDNSYRMDSRQYTINTANTWEYKTLTFDGDTAGVINDDNGDGLLLEWWLNSGSTFTGGSHSTTWQVQDNSARNASNIAIGAAVNDSFQITGVQLEVGSKSTPFEHRSYADELARCQRYYETGSVKMYGGGLNTGQSLALSGQFKVSKRAGPTMTYSTAFARNHVPNSTEWSEVDSFGCIKNNTQELAFVWTAAAEL